MTYHFKGVINISKKYSENVNYHVHRTHRFTVATKDQKDFSEGYLEFTALLHMDDPDITVKDKNDFVSKRLAIARDKKNPEHQQAKGFIASMFDFKKQIPKDMTVWGRIKK